MQPSRWFLWLALFLFGAGFSARAADVYDPRLRFRIKLDRSLGTNRFSGRLLVLMTNRREPVEVVEPSAAEMQSTWICAREVENLKAGDALELDPDGLAFPQGFSHAPGGNWQIMALLDTAHTLGYSGVGPGACFGPVVRVMDLAPKQGGTVELQLTRQVPANPPLVETATKKLVVRRSELLGAFWGRSVEVRAAVLLPPSYATNSAKRYPTVYQIHAFGLSHAAAWDEANGCCGPAPQELAAKMAAGEWPEMVYVFLDGSCPLGHHAFADSVNNGPWGRALVEEFIPYLERTFRLEAAPRARLLNGYATGGWSALWLQVTHPDFFGGAWAAAPDAVDFRSWSGLDLTKSPPENFYRKNATRPRWLIRADDRELVTVEDYAKWERVLADYGGQLGSFEAVFSPRGDNGRPLPLFNRDTGGINPVAVAAWQRYDIGRFLQANWATLGTRLQGKLHVLMGAKDSIHLEEAAHLLEDTLKGLGGDAAFDFVEGRNHFDLFAEGVAQGMALEMFRATQSPAAAGGR